MTRHQRPHTVGWASDSGSSADWEDSSDSSWSDSSDDDAISSNDSRANSPVLDAMEVRMLHTERSHHDGERVTSASRRCRKRDLEAQRSVSSEKACKNPACRDTCNLEMLVFCMIRVLAPTFIFFGNDISCTVGLFRAFWRYFPLFYIALCGRMILVLLESEDRPRFSPTVHALPLILGYVFCLANATGQPILPSSCRGILEVQSVQVQLASPDAALISPRSPRKMVVSFEVCDAQCAGADSSGPDLYQSEWAACYKACLDRGLPMATPDPPKPPTDIVIFVEAEAEESTEIMGDAAVFISGQVESESVEE